MGQELPCKVAFEGKLSDGRALLETDELIFRGDVRLKIAYKEITRVESTGGALHITFPAGTAVFHLGPAASKWANKILHLPTRLDKLGVTSQTTYQVIGSIEPGFLEELGKAGAQPAKNPEITFLAAEDPSGLKALTPNRSKAIWVVFPKGQKHITEGDDPAGRTEGRFGGHQGRTVFRHAYGTQVCRPPARETRRKRPLTKRCDNSPMG